MAEYCERGMNLRVPQNAGKFLSGCEPVVLQERLFSMELSITITNKEVYPTCGPGSVVGIATSYGLDGPGIESRWGGEISRTCPDRPWGPPSLLYNGYRVFPGGKERPGSDADHSPTSNAVVMKR